jgi:ParB family chromosome partitioning protein
MSNDDSDKPEPKDDSDEFRDREELTNAKVKDLAKDISANGIVTPLSVQPLPDGRYRLAGGYRRFRALRRLRP